jgi:FkbM family methyltransferase
VRKYLSNSGLVIRNNLIDFPKFAESIKIDVGLSGNAPQSEIWTQHDSKVIVIGFEPIAKNRRMIAAHASPWPIKLDPLKLAKSVFIIPVALSSTSHSKKLIMHITDDDPGCSSLLTPTELKHSTFEYVPVFCLQDFFVFFDFQQHKYIDHVKIDAQGMDFEILIGCKKYLKYISYVTAEVDRSYEKSQNSIFKLKIYMLIRGFIKVGKFNSMILKLFYNHKIICSDPTFFNLRLFFQNRKNLFIYQQG